MTERLSPREFKRRARQAFGRMTPLQRDIFRALRFEDASYPELAERYGRAVREVEQAFVAALIILGEVYDAPPPWWRRLLL